MTHKLRGLVAVFSVVALASVIVAAPSSAATTQGVGSAGGSTTIAGLDAGDLLQLALVGEQSAASLDPTVGTPSATETLAPLTLTSNLLPALNAATVPQIQTQSSGDPDVKNTALLDLGSLPGGVLGGTINPATLTSLIDANGALSSLTSTLANFNVLQGVVNVDSANLDLGGLAGPTSSVGNRAITVDGITVLDLRALLNLLGLDLNQLPLSVLTNLLGQLNLLGTLNAVTNSTFANPGDLLNTLLDLETQAGPAFGQLAGAQSAVDAATAPVAAATAAVTAALGNLAGPLASLNACLAINLPVICAPLQAIVDPLQTAVSSAQGVLATAQGVLATAQAALQSLLDTLGGLLGSLNNLLAGLGNVLASAKLLSVEGIQVGAIATAKDTVDASSAIVTGAVGDIKIGGLDIGGLDANATLDQVLGLAGQITGVLNSVLTTISPSLANLVQVKLFDQATDVSQDGSYVNALAGITGLIATVTPPDLCALLGDVLGQLPVGGNTLPGVSLPALPIGGLLSSVGSVVSCTQSFSGGVRPYAIAGLPALTNPITLKVASASSAASFTATPGQTPNNPTTTNTPNRPALPRTGGDSTLLLIVGALLAAAALATRRTLLVAKARG